MLCAILAVQISNLRKREQQPVTTHEKLLQQQIQEFTRRFGLLDQNVTPCNYPISPSQAHALQVLALADKMTLQTLAMQLNLDKSTVSRLVTQMVDLEWVLRTVNQENRREIHLALTSTGRVILDQVLEAGSVKYQRLYERLPPEKRADILEALALLNDALWAEQTASTQKRRHEVESQGGSTSAPLKQAR